MSVHRPARRWAGAAVLGALVVLLSACNPTSKVHDNAQVMSSFGYHGTVDAWFDVQVIGAPGFTASYHAGILGSGSRSCSAPQERVLVACTNYGDYIGSADRSAAGAGSEYWPSIKLHPGETGLVVLHCARDGASAPCPQGTKVTARTVDDAGELVGDLT
jgi:hypothetical protein